MNGFQTMYCSDSGLTSMADLINALVAEWEQIPAARFQNLVESLPITVEAVIATD